jgi:glycolate oxidase iron-sulfur subunit
MLTSINSQRQQNDNIELLPSTKSSCRWFLTTANSKTKAQALDANLSELPRENEYPGLARIIQPISIPASIAPGLPDYETLRHCVRCARCLPECPTYQETTLEIQSPRGRLALLKAVEDGRLALSSTIEKHLYHCLDCRMCDSVCPAGVTIGQSILEGRAACYKTLKQPWWKSLVLRRVLISSRRLGWFMRPLRLYQRLGFTRLVRALLNALPAQPIRRMAAMERLMPTLPEKALAEQLPERLEAIGERKYRVAFFLGCMMSQVLAEEAAASIRVLRRLGCEVIVPRGQMCCGSPQEDQGDGEQAGKLARWNVRLFRRFNDVDAIVADCPACSGSLKHYGESLAPDADIADDARWISGKTEDICEWLNKIMPENTAPGPALKVTYHEACHLANLQNIRMEPRRILQRLPGIELVEMEESNACCGSAGIYNLTHAETAEKRRQRKLRNIGNTGVKTVVTTGPGCLLQLRAAAGKDDGWRIMHLSQLIEETLLAVDNEKNEN